MSEAISGSDFSRMSPVALKLRRANVSEAAEALAKAAALMRATALAGGASGAGAQSFSVAQPGHSAAILCHMKMKVEEIAEAVAKLPPDQLARFRRWFTAFEAGRTNHAEELDSAATKLGRLAGRAFAELKRRAKEP
jgi:hypothetical protein